MITANDLQYFECNPYKLLEGQAKKKVQWRNKEYCDSLLNALISEFDYTKSEEYEHINDDTIERILRLGGLIGFFKDGDTIRVGFAHFNGKLNDNGLSNNVSITTMSGETFVRDISECVVGRNNPQNAPELDLYRFADMFAEVDLSMVNNVQYCRIYPLFVAKSRKIADAIKEFFKRDHIGDSVMVGNDTVLGDKTSIEPIKMTDDASISKLQYLSQFHNDLLRRICTKHGHALGESMKLAQQSVEEVSANQSMSFVTPLLNLKMREQMCKDLAAMFGGSITVGFSPAWEVSYNDFKADIRAEGKPINDNKSEVNDNE